MGPAGLRLARGGGPMGDSMERDDADSVYAKLRAKMVERQIRPMVDDPRVLEAMGEVPRHLFVPELLREGAYEDRPLPIGHGQTISQPLMVARMLAVARLRGTERVLEVGAGSGYQAALLGRLAREVYAIEIVEDLADRARELLSRLGYDNVTVVTGDGGGGHRAGAPYDAILVAAAARQVPKALPDQLAEGGRLVIPVGAGGLQQLERVTRRGKRFETERLEYCAFVPLVGTAQSAPAVDSGADSKE